MALPNSSSERALPRGQTARAHRALIGSAAIRLRQLWRLLRQASGDDAYERYLAHMQAEHPQAAVLGRSAYYRLRLEQKWSRVARCC